MDCPVCKTVKLMMSDRQGIEIDYCPNCRGVWLDRGELDKIIDRSAGVATQSAPQPVRNDQYREQSHQPHGYGGAPQQGYPKKKKREGFLGELFDFD